MGDIEKIIAYNNVKCYLNENQRKELLQSLNINKSNLKTRLRGLIAESEFYIIMHLLNSCKHILSFDESTSVLTNSYSPDCLLVLNDNSKIFVEIKSKDKREYKISRGNLRKKIDFADCFGIKLYFAVKFKHHWGLFNSDFVVSRKGNLRFPEDYRDSVFEEVFNSRSIIFPKGIKVKKYYSKNKDALIGIQHQQYGNLYKYEFFFNDILIFSIDKRNEVDTIKSVVLELLHDAMNQQNSKLISNKNDEFILIQRLMSNIVCWDFQFLFTHLNHIKNDLGLRYDATSFYKNIVEERGRSYFTLELLFTVLNQLIDAGVPIIVTSLKKK
ncbi:MAG: hypothetical protein K9N07_10805 [Candidatus Cloacimonetes bacterium]|nr:hypothetical protein [Candidatus Cloacimonadota bacterium]